MEKDNLYGKMEIFIRDNSKITINMDMEN